MTAIAETPAPPVPRLPTQDDLPYSDGEPLESNWHVLQMELLREPLKLHWADRRRFFVGSNMFLYFNAEKLRSQDFRGPDLFVALEVADRSRKSWVVWDEGKAPDVVIELLSESTAEIDRTVKKKVYQDEVRVPEYFWYDPASGGLAGFTLCDGVYQPIPPDASGRLASPRLGLYLARWQGNYGREEAEWVRWTTAEGVLLPTSAELAETAIRRADEEQRRADEEQRRAGEERQRADKERQRAQRLVERLQALGVDPDE